MSESETEIKEQIEKVNRRISIMNRHLPDETEDMYELSVDDFISPREVRLARLDVQSRKDALSPSEVDDSIERVVENVLTEVNKLEDMLPE